MGNRDDFDEFYQEWWDQSVQTARRVVGTSTAEEVAAEAFLKAYVRWTRVRRLAHKGPWLLLVTLRLALRQQAKNQRETQRSEQSDAWSTEPWVWFQSVETPEDLVVSNSAVLGLLDRLPKRQREVVALRYLADVSEAETAELLRMAQSTVKQHAQRAMSNLRASTPLPKGDSAFLGPERMIAERK